MSSPTSPDDQGAEQPFISHLLELRDRLIRMLMVIALVFLALFPFANEIYTAMAAPIIAKLPEGATMIATQVASPFLTPFKLTLMVAIFVAMPYVLYQIWAFVAPGLYRHEKRLAVPLLVSSILLFYVGMAFAFFVVFPLVFAFFAAVTPDGVTQMPDIAFYLEFILKLFFAFGLAFEIPIATILLVAIGATTPGQLARQRPYIIVGAFIAGMLLTPPDVISQTLLALPMWLLFELGILFSRILLAPGRAAETPDDEPATGANDVATEAPAGAALVGDERPVSSLEQGAASGAAGHGAALVTDEVGLPDSAAAATKLERVKYLRDRDNDGDLDEVRRLLYQVLSEGSTAQQGVARNILAQLDM